jgi:hypothetical protein
VLFAPDSFEVGFQIAADYSQLFLIFPSVNYIVIPYRTLPVLSDKNPTVGQMLSSKQRGP